MHQFEGKIIEVDDFRYEKKDRELTKMTPGTRGEAITSPKFCGDASSGLPREGSINRRIDRAINWRNFDKCSATSVMEIRPY